MVKVRPIQRPIKNCDPFDPLTHDPLIYCLIWARHRHKAAS